MAAFRFGLEAPALTALTDLPVVRVFDAGCGGFSLFSFVSLEGDSAARNGEVGTCFFVALDALVALVVLAVLVVLAALAVLVSCSACRLVRFVDEARGFDSSDDDDVDATDDWLLVRTGLEVLSLDF